MKTTVGGSLELIQKSAARLWLGIREWCGDAAYERYQEAHARRGCGEAQLSRRDFYVAQLEKRYSRVSRCC
jgi:Selenoprotein, putative